MKEIHFKLNGSSADFGIRYIYNEVKKTYPSAKLRTTVEGTYTKNAFISIPEDQVKEVLLFIRGFASQALICA